MKAAVQSILGLLAGLCLQLAWGAEARTGNFEECIYEPVFEGKVCTLRANRDAKVGVILIHGLGGSIDDWKNTIPALAKHLTNSKGQTGGALRAQARRSVAVSPGPEII